MRSFINHLSTLLIYSSILVSAGQTKSSANYLSGPVEAQLIEVIDGDTVRVQAQIWLGQSISVLVRLKGIDAPEISQPACAAEHRRANQARQHLASLVTGQKLKLTSIHGGKYFGRVIAKINVNNRYDVSRQMLASGLVRSYHKGRRAGWCG